MSQVQLALSIQQQISAFLSNSRDHVNLRLVHRCFRYFPFTNTRHRSVYWKRLSRNVNVSDDRILNEILYQQDYELGFKAVAASGRSELVFKILNSNYGPNYEKRLLLSAAVNGHSALATKIANSSNNVNEDLIVGCMSGNLELVELCLSKQPSLNAINLAVHVAMKRKKRNIFSSICRKFHHMITDKRQALTCAIDNNDVEVVKVLMGNYANTFARQQLSRTITWSSKNGYLEDLVDQLLQQDAMDAVLIVEALNLAAEFGLLKLVNRLLKDQSVDADFSMAMRTAAENGHSAVVSRLLQDPRVDPSTFYDIAIRNSSMKGFLLVVDILLKDQRVEPSARNNEAIRFAAQNGHLEVVNRLLEDPRVDPTAGSNNAIVNALQNGHLSVVDRLLEDPRVDPSANDHQFVFDAVQKGYVGILHRLLQDPRVDPSACNNCAMIIAAKNGDFQIIDLLLRDQRVDPSVKNNCAIGTAAQKGNLKVVDRLLQDPRVDPLASSAVLEAAQKGHLQVVERLLQDHRCWNMYNLIVSFELELDSFSPMLDNLLLRDVVLE